MLRDSLIAHHHVVDDFRWRTREILRIEGFSDAVFGFAVTLLIVSLEVPKTSTELFETMHGFIGFVLTFMMLAGMWYAQFIFFRRYGLEDRTTVLLNLVLLFTVLFFVYPLKFLMSVIVADPTLKSAAVAPAHRPWIFAIFGVGMAAVFTVFVLLYGHAYRKREELGLNEVEVYETRHSIRKQLLTICLALTYLGLAVVFSMPHRNAHERMLMLTVDLGDLAIMMVILGTLLRLNRRRKLWIADWRLRQANAAPSGSVD